MRAAIRRGDLTRVTVGFATDKLNDERSAGPASARIDPPEVSLPIPTRTKIIPDVSEIKSLDTIVSGLAAQFGEKELGTDASAELSSRMITAADDDKVGTLVKAPFAAAKEMRGWVYPRNIDDVFASKVTRWSSTSASRTAKASRSRPR